MIALRSVLFNFLFVLWTAVMGTLAILSLVFPERFVIWVQVTWGRGASWHLCKVAGIDIEVRGRHNIPTGPAVVASKHQSAWETGAFHSLLTKPSIVLKKELLWLPFFGLYCRKTGMIPVDRSGRGASLRHLLRVAHQVSDEGRPILIFPEGTRVAPGEKHPYLVGIAGLYKSLDVPVVPVALNSGLFWPRGFSRRCPGTIVVEFLDPIPPRLGRKEFMARLEEAIESKTAELIEEATSAGAAVDNSLGVPL
ncbi:MAG: lysophospholipid acyltransferase family protein [Sphingomonadales bacterium]